MNIVKYAGLIVLVLGIVAVAIGAAFIAEGFMKNSLIVDRMNVEKVTLAVDPDNPGVATQINNADDAQKAADTIASHRRNIAPTYQDLLGGKPFDPTNITQLKYSQAMNLENYLYLAVTAFGLIQVTIINGVFMVIVGLAIGTGGFALYRLSRVKA
jgi:hypothetical protein